MNFLFTTNATKVSKIIFESLRNSFVCGAVAVAGVAINKYPKLSFAGPELAPTISFVVFSLATVLLIWNVVLTYTNLHKNAKVRTKRFWLIDMPIFAIYLTVSISIFGAAIKLQGSQLKSPSQLQKNS